MLSRIISALFVFTLIAHQQSALAEDDAHHHSPHVHGMASLNLAIENDTMIMQFKSPAYDLVGFEHDAETEEEIDAVEKVETILESPKEIFSFADAQCESVDIIVDTSSIKHDDHDDGHDHHDHDNDHSEILATYIFRCDTVDKLTTISTSLFDHFPSIEDIKVEWITDVQQGASNISKDTNEFSIR